MSCPKHTPTSCAQVCTLVPALRRAVDRTNCTLHLLCRGMWHVAELHQVLHWLAAILDRVQHMRVVLVLRNAWLQEEHALNTAEDPALQGAGTWREYTVPTCHHMPSGQVGDLSGTWAFTARQTATTWALSLSRSSSPVYVDKKASASSGRSGGASVTS